MRLIFTFLLVSAMVTGFSQNTIVLQPDWTAGQDANVASFDPYINYGDQKLMQAFQWLFGPDTLRVRAFFRFDLSEIPEGKYIESALLSLYGNEDPTGATDAHSTIDGSNESYLYRVIEPWDEYTITWNNQPAWTENDNVLLPGSTSAAQDYIDIDITNIIRYQYNNQAANFGFVMINRIREPHRSMTFLSSDHHITAERPKLEITYTESQGIPETGGPQFSIYPNPASDQISLKLDENFGKSGKVTVVITDLIGNRIFSANFKGWELPDEIDISQAPAGIYFVRIQSESLVAIRKLIKKD